MDWLNAGPKTAGVTDNASSFTLKNEMCEWLGRAGRSHVQAMVRDFHFRLRQGCTISRASRILLPDRDNFFVDYTQE
jgi:hypothetical protein